MTAGKQKNTPVIVMKKKRHIISPPLTEEHVITPPLPELPPGIAGCSPNYHPQVEIGVWGAAEQ
ncbi:hypothetical protein XR96_14785 [Salmonella enterica]|nr:hypothetical protein [Salmonella enterica]ECE6504321.1 hypothetical protein [Salmonella enterica subsp. salamae]MEI04917.1 hypothetical protein [Salmonella enterica]MJG41613.1 hypothetical protein [Salmonella enterica subsp. salamae]